VSQILDEVLSVKKHGFREFINRIEKICLNPSIDIRLSYEINIRTKQKIKQLGLDISDTTTEELFHALKGRLISDDVVLRKVLNIENASPLQTVESIAKKASDLSVTDYSLSLSMVGVKRVLKAVPPRKTLKILKYRSLDSVLKRKDARLLYALAAQLEDESWHTQVQAKIKRLPAKDISWNKLEVIVLPTLWFEKCRDKLAEKGIHLVSPEVGIVMLLPVSSMKKPGMVTLALGFVLHALQQISISSTPYRRSGFMQGYNSALPEIVIGQVPQLTSLHGIEPTWRIVHELLANGYLDEHLPDMELQINELTWQTAEHKISNLTNNFEFWSDTQYLALKGDKAVVSLNLLDVAASVIKNSEYGFHTNTHLENSLWNELCIRYLRQNVFAKSLVKQLLPMDEIVIL
jgi:hypothetical protein